MAWRKVSTEYSHDERRASCYRVQNIELGRASLGTLWLQTTAIEEIVEMLDFFSAT